MRPIHLSVEGLACFKERQEIDFSDLDLFAISGPTGAGKSTLLDAILFALYGEVPRVGKHDLKEMISAARDRVSVRFDFSVGEHKYRIARALRRRGAASVRLDEHGRTGYKPIADQVRTASVEVTRLLGLDVDAFTQAVILPQGEFARFLKTDPRKRREMLRTLLRLDVYERMRQAAQDTSTRKKHDLDALEQRLSEEYQGISDVVLAELQITLQQTEAQLEVRRKESDSAAARLIELRDRHAKTVDLVRSEARLAELRGIAPQINEARREIEAAGRAAALVPLIEETDRAAGGADHAKNAAEEARQASEAAARVHEKHAQKLARAGEQTNEIPLLRTQVAKLDRILGRLPDLRRLEAEVGRKRSRIDQLEQEVTQRSEHLKELQQKASRQRDAEFARKSRNAAEEARQASETAAHVHEDRVRELAHAEEQTKEIPVLRARVAKLDRILGRLPDLRRLEAEVGKKRGRIDRLEQEVMQCRKHLEQLGEEATRQQTSVEVARTELDAIGYDAELDEAIGRVRETATKLTISRESLQQAKPERQRRRRTRDGLAVEVDRLKSEVAEREGALHDAEKDVAAAEEALHAAHRQDAANDLRESLVAGAPCPVCTQLVADPPAADVHPDVAAARVGRENTRATLRRVRKEMEQARNALAVAEGGFRASQKALAEADDAACVTLAIVRQCANEIREALGRRAPYDDDAVDAWLRRQVHTLATARSSFEDARRCLETADLQLIEQRRREERTRSDFDQKHRARSERIADLDADEARLRAVRAEIADVTRSADPAQERANLSSRIDDLETGHSSARAAEAEARHELAAKQHAHEARERTAKEAAKEALARMEQQRRDEETARDDLDRTRRARSERIADLDADEERVRTVRAEIAEVTRSADPAQERTNLSSRIDDLETGHRDAMATEAEARRELAVKQQAHEDREQAAKEANRDAVARIEHRDQCVAQARFDSVGDALEAVRDDTTQARLREAVADHERDLDVTERHVRNLQNHLGEERVSDDQLEEARSNERRIKGAVEELVGERAHLRQQVKTMIERLQRAQALRRRLRAQRDDYRLFGGLATDLRSDRFQAYVLEDSFTRLVQGASDRLFTLSGQRYALTFRDDQILVVDHDNADDTRISDTLSGGETFLASLSLALELSRQVQDAAGAVHLDSLFIDEGFGTLDPDTLATVSETIQSLQVSGRVVGVITHIPELRDEFSQQIHVTKHHGYSRVQVRGSL